MKKLCMSQRKICFHYKVPMNLFTKGPPFLFLKNIFRGVWVIRLVKRATVDFGSGHELTLCQLEPWVGH